MVWCKLHNVYHRGRLAKMSCKLALRVNVLGKDDFVDFAYKYRTMEHDQWKHYYKKLLGGARQ